MRAHRHRIPLQTCKRRHPVDRNAGKDATRSSDHQARGTGRHQWNANYKGHAKIDKKRDQNCGTQHNLHVCTAARECLTRVELSTARTEVFTQTESHYYSN